MFTGIITDVGRVVTREPHGAAGDTRLTIRATQPLAGVALGASIACSGVCLTVVAHDAFSFAVDVSGESLARTTIGAWQPGTPVNLERALKVGDELGGHIVSGHVDGVGRVVSIAPAGGSSVWRFAAPADLAKFIAEKGSIAVDGVSLTVNRVEGCDFWVNLIPHTIRHTAFGETTVDAAVHLEIDMLARYVARLIEAEGTR
jgi:riboflavin synthase